jgi:hypothetical protein
MLTQAEINALCTKAARKYAAMSTNDAMLEISYEIQGWVGAQVKNGISVRHSIYTLIELLIAIKEAQEDKNHETVMDLPQKR